MAQSMGQRKRLSVDRCLRLWGIVEHISLHAGLGRLELAQAFALSERQLQADLNVIRDRIGLPLVRVHGYRFAGAPAPSHALTLTDLVALAPMIQQARTNAAAPPEPLAALANRLPSLFLPSIQELARAALRLPLAQEHIQSPEDFLLLADAWLRTQPVRLQYLSGTGPGFASDPVVVPQVLMPYEGSWYVIGPCPQAGRVALFALDAVQAVAFADGA